MSLNRRSLFGFAAAIPFLGIAKAVEAEKPAQRIKIEVEWDTSRLAESEVRQAVYRMMGPRSLVKCARVNGVRVVR